MMTFPFRATWKQAAEKLSFSSQASAAWLADRPSHGEVLDRLRQRRRLPESADYARWRKTVADAKIPIE